MDNHRPGLLSRRGLLKAGAGAAGVGLFPWSSELLGAVAGKPRRPGESEHGSQSVYSPPPERDGGWRVIHPSDVGVDAALLRDAILFHDRNIMTTSYGGAVVIVHKGHVIGESYTTGSEGGPQPWTAQSCNDMKSSTKSVFGTAVGVFLDEYRDRCRSGHVSGGIFG